MERPLVGEIVVMDFPYADLTGSKRRPALILATLEGRQVLLCKITSRTKLDKYSIPTYKGDFLGGKLAAQSIIRPNMLFTANESVIRYTVCRLKRVRVDRALAEVASILTQSRLREGDKIRLRTGEIATILEDFGDGRYIAEVFRITGDIETTEIKHRDILSIFIETEHVLEHSA
ncbi:MAG: type II toxin-antitoxin system PemK/MazF family toxin [Clostridiales bacterium]|jgi:mRNA interferase MazF|nr:type II toxin-antitoxin system PemK/MazF family toxin [Clostridiales bacterium]